MVDKFSLFTTVWGDVGVYIGYPYKVISGTVYADANSNGRRDAGEEVLKGVRVHLYMTFEDPGIIAGHKEGVKVRRQDLAASALTDSSGRYTFYTMLDMPYTLAVDVNTLPKGKGVVNPEIYIEQVPTNKGIDFIVRDIAQVEVESSLKAVNTTGYVPLKPAVKDINGVTLSACVECDYDSRSMKGTAGGLSFQDDGFRAAKTAEVEIRAGSVSKKVVVSSQMPYLSSIEKTDLAYRRGAINEKEKMLLYAYSVFERIMLPWEYYSENPVKCVTCHAEELYIHLKRRRADREVLGKLAEYFKSAVPALDSEYVSPGGFFKLHYTTSGVNAVPEEDLNSDGIPDYIETMAEAFDNALNVICKARGFRRPLRELNDRFFHIYVFDLNGKYGVTLPVQLYASRSRKKTRVATCLICMDNNYAKTKGFKADRDEYIKATAAHELFHAVQNAYNFNADKWWKEATAIWNEEEVFPFEFDCDQYIARMGNLPGAPLDEGTCQGALFVRFLSQHYGGCSIVKRIWEALASGCKSSLEAIDMVLKELNHPGGFKKAFDRFTAFNYSPSGSCEGGRPSAIAAQNTWESYPIYGYKESVPHLAAGYEVFKAPPGKKGTLAITLQTDTKVPWGLKLQKRRGDGSCDLTELKTVSVSGRLEILCEGFGDVYSEVCLIPANLHSRQDDAVYAFSARLLEEV